MPRPGRRPTDFQVVGRPGLLALAQGAWCWCWDSNPDCADFELLIPIASPGRRCLGAGDPVTRVSHRRGRGSGFERAASGRKLPPLIAEQTAEESALSGDAGHGGLKGWGRSSDSVALADVIQDALDDAGLGDEADHANLGSAARTHERVHLVHSPDESRRRCPGRLVDGETADNRPLWLTRGPQNPPGIR